MSETNKEKVNCYKRQIDIPYFKVHWIINLFAQLTAKFPQNTRHLSDTTKHFLFKWQKFSSLSINGFWLGNEIDKETANNDKKEECRQDCKGKHEKRTNVQLWW